MNVSRKALQVRGDVPGLLRRGMPVQRTVAPEEDAPFTERALVVTAADRRVEVAVHDQSRGRGITTSDAFYWHVDWSDPAALYLCLHWLADRGHLCGWMLPTTHGGRVEAWDGLTAWEVAAVLVSHEVALRAAGRPGIKHLLADYRPETLVGRNGREEYLSRWAIGGVRRIGPPRVVTIGPDGWHYDRAVLARGADVQTCDHDKGPETGSAGKLAADTAAIADGCCLQVPGGLVVPT